MSDFGTASAIFQWASQDKPIAWAAWKGWPLPMLLLRDAVAPEAAPESRYAIIVSSLGVMDLPDHAGSAHIKIFVHELHGLRRNNALKSVISA
jgi:hypothetical protein